MDVWGRVRVLIWLLIFSLWGVMVFQFLEEDEAPNPSLTAVVNPYRGSGQPLPALPEPPAQDQAPESAPPAGAPLPDAKAPLEPSPGGVPPGLESPDRIMVKSEAEAASASPKLGFLKPLPPKIPVPQRPKTKPARLRPEAKIADADPPIPSGFVKSVTRHFNVYAETDPASPEFLNVLESLHGNLMLDLAAFSPWARDQRVSIFLFKSQDTYRRVTGRPAWSGGASSVPRRKVYVYESDELTGILAHELCHIYYDSFFLGGRPNPLWLSEGMATLIQIERGMASPNWLRENLDILKSEGGFTIADLMRVSSTSGADDEKVRLWYTQAYSVVRFLIRYQYKSSFYNFSRHLRDGKGAPESLYRAYGAPFTSLKALEYAWRYDVNTNALSHLTPSQR